MAEAPAPAPMEVETPPPEEEEEECMHKEAFKKVRGFPASGDGTSTLLAICRKMRPALVPKADPHPRHRRTKSVLEKFDKLLGSDRGAELKVELFRYRRRAIKQWNKERRAEEKAVAGVVDDGPVPYPESGESVDILAGVFRERSDLAAEARGRFGDDLRGFTNLAQSLGQQLLASEAPEDIELIKKLYAHRDARYAAWRKTRSSADGRKGRDGRTLGSAASQTRRKAANVNWSDEAGEKGTKALVDVLEPLDVTPPRGDAKWDAIAETVSTAAGRDYTAEQCYGRARNEGHLRAELPEAHIYDPSMRNWRPRTMQQLLRTAGLDSKVLCGKAALKAGAFKHVPTYRLEDRLRDVYNLGTEGPRGDRDKLIAALVEAEMCAVDPRANGATRFERASSPRFRQAFAAEMLPRVNVLKSLRASEACLESSSEATRRDGWDDLSRTNAAIYGRLLKQNTTHLCFLKLGLASYEAPSTRMAPLLNEFFFRPLYVPHIIYDAAQDCTCCRGLYEDNGFATCLEHAHEVQLGCCAIRNNGACEFAASPSFERHLRRRRLHARSAAWSVLLFNFHTGNKCNTSWIEFFDKLAREFKIETLREKRDVAVAANKRWGRLSPRRRAWKYD